MKKIMVLLMTLSIHAGLLGMMPADLDTSTNGSANPFNGTLGYHLIDNGTYEFFYSVDIDSNDKIVAIGRSNDNGFVARYNDTGTLDTTFSGDGKYELSTAFAIGARGVVDSNNNIIIAGRSNSNLYQITLAKVKSDGSGLDTNFGLSGEYSFSVNGTDNVTFKHAVIDSNDKVIVVGSYYNGSKSVGFVARILSDGSGLDTTFNGTGMIKETAVSTGNVTYSSVALDSTGRIIVGAEFYDNSGYRDVAVARYTAVGGVESGFGNLNSIVGTGGIMQYNFASSSSSGDAAVHVAVKSNDDIVVSGEVFYSGWKNFVAQFKESDGSLDTANFNSGGSPAGVHYFNIGGSNFYNESGGMAIDSADKIVIVGNVLGGQEGIVRFYSDGTLDDTFSGDGIFYDFDGSNSLSLYDVVIQPNGKIVFVGTENGGNQMYIGRMFGDEVVLVGADGGIDTNFGTNGELTLNGTASMTTGDLRALHVLSDGSMFVVNDAGADTEVVKLTAAHAADGTFNIGSKVTLAGATHARYVTISVNSDVLVCGDDGAAGADSAWLHKIDASGNVVGGFSVTDTIDQAFKVVEQSNGRWILAGSEDGVATLIAYNPVDGSVDTSFGGAGTGRYTIAGISNPIVDLTVIDGTDEILIAYVDGSNQAQVKKLTPNARSEVSGFTLGTVIGSVAGATQVRMRRMADGKIVVVARDGSNNFVARRYTAAGADDAGATTVNVTNLNDLSDLLALSDGKVVILGKDSSNNLILVRLTSVLATDADFASAGISTIDASTMTNFAAVDVQSDNSLLVAGS